jgi:hypothetical protein
MSMIEAQGWGPPGTWSRHPQDCDCGCGGGGWGNIQDCWRQTAELKAIIRQVVTGMNLNMGVTDGSDPKPGEIGEYFTNTTTFNYTAAQQTNVVNAGVLSPGDWSVFACFKPSQGISGASFQLTPVLTGVSNIMTGLSWDQDTGASGASFVGTLINSEPARASLKVPTMFAFTVNTNISGTNQAGTGTFLLQAWRMR